MPKHIIGYDQLTNSNVYGCADITMHNLNQGIFKGHFYFGKKSYYKDKWVDSVIFDNGHTAIDFSALLSSTEKEKRTKEGTLEPEFCNQIKKEGINYKFSLIPLQSQWENHKIYDFISAIQEIKHGEWVKKVSPEDAQKIIGNIKNYVENMENGGAENVCNVSNVCISMTDNINCEKYPEISDSEGSEKLLYKPFYNNKKFDLYAYSVCILHTIPTLTFKLPTFLNFTYTPIHNEIMYIKQESNKRYFDTIKGIFEYYMDIKDERIFVLLPTYVIATFCYELFDAIGYLFFNSERESGKTKCATIIENLCFNPVNSTSPTESVLFRLIEQTKGTVFIDDFEKLSEDKKNTILQILKVGYKKGGQTARSEKVGDSYVPTFFDVYSPKVITNTTYLEDITLSRCIPLHFLRTQTNKGRRNPNPNDEFWRELRNFGYFFTLTNWREIKAIYDNYENDKFNNRSLEISKGLLSIAKFISQEYHDILESYLYDCFEQRDTWEYEGSKDYKLLNTIFKQVSTEPMWVTPKRIAEWYIEEYPDDYKPFTPVWIGRHLNKVPLFSRKRHAGGSAFCFSKDIVANYMILRGYSVEGYEPKSRQELIVERDDLSEGMSKKEVSKQELIKVKK